MIAVKTLSVGVWRNRTCSGCGKTFDVEAQEARMAPAALFVCSPEEPSYTIRNDDTTFDCPHCGHVNKTALGNPDKKDKKVDLTLLIHPEWLKGHQAKMRRASNSAAASPTTPKVPPLERRASQDAQIDRSAGAVARRDRVPGHAREVPHRLWDGAEEIDFYLYGSDLR